MIIVQAFPRIHLGLVDLGGALGRRYGGGGFMLESPYLEVAVERNKSGICGFEVLDSRGRRDVAEALERIQRIYQRRDVRISLLRIPTPHIGMGTKTALFSLF